MKKYLISPGCIFLIIHCISGQNLNAILDAYRGENAKGYINPLVDLIGANLNTGSSEWAALDSGFHVRLSVIGSASFPASKMKVFNATTEETFTPSSTHRVPTVIGKNEAITIQGVNETAYTYPTGYNLQKLLMVAPQISVGSILNTELTARFFAFDFEGDLGKFQFFGAGIRHALDPYLKSLPFNLNVGYMFQNLEVGDEISLTSHLPSVWLGKAGKHFSAQAMLGYQILNGKINYTYVDGTTSEQIALNLKNDVPYMAEISLGVKLGVLIIHAAANYSGPVTGAAGITFKF